MKLSAYNFVIGAKQRRYPYAESIASALMIADEFCIAYDPEFDNPSLFTNISPKVKAIPVHIDFTEWDFVCKHLTTARRECSGDYCLYLEADEVLHERDAPKILDAVGQAGKTGAEAITIKYINMCGNCVKSARLLNPDTGTRQKITINANWLYHKTSDDMFDFIDSEYMEGRFIKSGIDEVAYHDERIEGWFHDPNAVILDDYSKPLQTTLKEFIQTRAFIWHYTVYNYSRKREQGRQTRIWQDRAYGRTGGMDIPELKRLLKERIEPNPVFAEQIQKLLVERDGWIPIDDLCHPASMTEWLEQMEFVNIQEGALEAHKLIKNA